MQTAILEAQTFTTLLPLIQKAHPNISFWGQRYVHIVGHKGTWPIDTLVDHVLKMVERNFDFNEEERKAGKEIASLIDRLYVISDDQTQHLNYLTYIFCKLRDWWTRDLEANGYGPRFQWHDGKNKIFEYYTKTQYQIVFQSSPSHIPDLIATNCPDRWLLNDDE